MSWKSIIKRIDNYGDAWKRIQAHMAEDKIMRPKRWDDHPLIQEREQLYKELKKYPQDTWTNPARPEMKRIWQIDNQIDFEYRHAVGFFQGQEPEDIRPHHGFKQPKFTEEWYREQGYEPPQNKKHMKGSDWK
tara:strand:- start:9 stop:407 length:399 start_codon:yes stop_codon:yes gene_type:complete